MMLVFVFVLIFILVGFCGLVLALVLLPAPRRLALAGVRLLYFLIRVGLALAGVRILYPLIRVGIDGNLLYLRLVFLLLPVCVVRIAARSRLVVCTRGASPAAHLVKVPIAARATGSSARPVIVPGIVIRGRITAAWAAVSRAGVTAARTRGGRPVVVRSAVGVRIAAARGIVGFFAAWRLSRIARGGRPVVVRFAVGVRIVAARRVVGFFAAWRLSRIARRGGSVPNACGLARGAA